jgi:hypothetical protein
MRCQCRSRASEPALGDTQRRGAFGSYAGDLGSRRLRQYSRVRVETATGVWHVRRRWAPRHIGSQTIGARFWDRTRRVRRRTTDVADLPDPGCAPDVAEGVVVFVGLVVLVLLLILVGIPLLVALGELVLILLLAIASVVGRVLFRRPWTVDAVSPDGNQYAWEVVGWRASAAARSFVAARVSETGHAPTIAEVAASSATA